VRVVFLDLVGELLGVVEEMKTRALSLASDLAGVATGRGATFPDLSPRGCLRMTRSLLEFSEKVFILRFGILFELREEV
jgi:hypothetical protein